jgi:hypothetical protein
MASNSKSVEDGSKDFFSSDGFFLAFDEKKSILRNEKMSQRRFSPHPRKKRGGTEKNAR